MYNFQTVNQTWSADPCSKLSIFVVTSDFNLVKINAEARHKDLFNEVVNYFEVEYVPGGCTLNTLRICQWMSLSESVAVFSGAIGNDNFGEILARTIERQKVKAHLVKGLFILDLFSGHMV